MIYVVTGPPCVGKSTWVRERAAPGDVVVDLDRIALAITAEGTAHHEYDFRIRGYARIVRRTAVQVAIVHSRIGTSYVIDARPGTRARRAYKQAMAQFINLDAPTSVLLARAQAERPAWVTAEIVNWNRNNEDEQILG